MTKRKLLITGAAGRIGQSLSRQLQGDFDLRLMVRTQEEEAMVSGFGEVVLAELEDLSTLKKIVEGVDTVIHLAGSSEASATWSELLPNNIVGPYNVLVASKAAGCRRVILASSIHAVSGYPRDVQVKTSDPVNPGDLYGVTKCFAEALGRYMAEKEGLSVITLRIGAYMKAEHTRHPKSLANMDAFLSDRDLVELVRRCIEVETVQYALVHAISDNSFKRLDMSETRSLLGFHPADDFSSEHPELASLGLSKRVRSHSEVADGGASGLRDDL